LGKNQGWKGEEPTPEKGRAYAGWAKAAFSVDEGSLGGKKAIRTRTETESRQTVKRGGCRLRLFGRAR